MYRFAREYSPFVLKKMLPLRGISIINTKARNTSDTSNLTRVITIGRSPSRPCMVSSTKPNSARSKGRRLEDACRVIAKIFLWGQRHILYHEMKSWGGGAIPTLKRTKHGTSLRRNPLHRNATRNATHVIKSPTEAFADFDAWYRVALHGV